MYYIQRHLQTKRCKNVQTLHKNVDPNNFNTTDAKFRLFIYDLKQNILHGIPTNSDNKVAEVKDLKKVVIDPEVNLLDL